MNAQRKKRGPKPSLWQSKTGKTFANAVLWLKFERHPVRKHSEAIREALRRVAGRNSAMRWHTSSASSSSANIVEDIIRLIAPPDRDAFNDMLKYELQGRGELPADEVRRIAERTWHQSLKHLSR